MSGGRDNVTHAEVTNTDATSDGDNSPGLLCYCRAGFEPEIAAELTERAALANLPGHARAERGTGYVLFLGDGVALCPVTAVDGRWLWLTLLWVAVVLTVVSGAHYLLRARRVATEPLAPVGPNW